MAELENKIQKDLVEAMKAKNATRVAAIRSIKTAIQTEKTNGAYHELADSDVVKLIQKLSKQRAEAEQIYLQASTPRYDLAEIEHNEKMVLDEYLPKMLSDEEINIIIGKIITATGAQSIKDMGKVMSALNKNYAGQYDGKTASGIIKSLLS